MRYQLRSLYWFFKKLYSPKEIKLLNKKIKKNLVSAAKDSPASNVIKTANVSLVNPRKIKELKRAFESVYNANKLNFGYNLFDSINPDFALNYNVYDSKVKGEYGYHADESYQSPISDIKLTALLNLSMEPYEGGKFYLRPFGAEFVVPEFSEPGDMVVFPAGFLHKVTPVTKGKRISLAIWLKGPKFT